MKTDLYQLANSVETEQDFLDFVYELMQDRNDDENVNQSSPNDSEINGWENGNIVSFLDAALAWGQASINGLELHEKPTNPWKKNSSYLTCR